MTRLPFALLLLLALPSCDENDSSPPPSPSTPMVLAAGMTSVEPSTGPNSDLGYPVETNRLQIARVDRVYRLTTPADTPFSFDALSRAAGNAGSVRVSVAHAADDRTVPDGGPESLTTAGCIVSGSGISGRNRWLDSLGDGFARLTFTGKIRRDQVLAIQTERRGIVTTALVEIAIGARSEINLAVHTGSNHPDVISAKTIYSSDAWRFGLPTVAVSGDRTSVVVYEGDRQDPFSPERFELRMQVDHKTDEVTGGGSEETSQDSGHWRDHEIAALFNVLALAHCGTDEVTLKLSFDRGATFAQTVTTPPGDVSTRLVQIAMAADYSVAVLFWRSSASGSVTELMLLEGRPSSVDANGSPTWFAFDPLQSLFRATGDVTPLLTGAAWSDGGDLVVGHASTEFRLDPNNTWTGVTQFWCATRPFGGEFSQRLVDQDILVGRDPSVALLGSGQDLEIFYAYEGDRGLRLRVSKPGSLNFGDTLWIGSPGSHTPTVFARRGTAGEIRVDVLYLTNAGAGSELHASRWLDFGNSPREDHRLTRSEMVPSAGSQGQYLIGFGWRVKQVGWMGYDAVLVGDEIAVVFDEEEFDAAAYFIFPWTTGGPLLGGGGQSLPPTFIPASPPPLAPGMTEKLPPPDATHRHQLKLVRLR